MKTKSEYYNEMSKYSNEELEAARTAIRISSFMTKNWFVFILGIAIIFPIIIYMGYFFLGNFASIIPLVIVYPIVYHFIMLPIVVANTENHTNMCDAYNQIVNCK